jgi:hypothetical protein
MRGKRDKSLRSNMVISDIQEQIEDLDWFGVDPNGLIAHFATGGCGFMPTNAKSSFEDMTLLKYFFRDELRPNGFATIPISFEKRFATISFLPGTIDPRTQFLHDHVHMASRGVYSFDFIMKPIRPSGYFLVAIPSNPLRCIDLPPNIQVILEKTRTKMELSKPVDEINIGDF